MTVLRLHEVKHNRQGYWTLHNNCLNSRPCPPELFKWLQQPDLDPSNLRNTALALQKRLQKLHIQALRLKNNDYPPQLKEMTFPPPLVYYRGFLGHLSRPTVGIVGCRKASMLGLKLAYGLASNLTHAGFSIVSGLATGIDTAALKGACMDPSFAPGIAILGTSIDQCYPTQNYALYSHLCRKGCVLSEYPPWFQTRPYHFIARNELIAACSDVLIVVEAGKTSGAFHTVNFALELNKPVLACDLPADGNQRLIAEGASVIQRVEDVFPLVYEFLKSRRFQVK